MVINCVEGRGGRGGATGFAFCTGTLESLMGDTDSSRQSSPSRGVTSKDGDDDEIGDGEGVVCNVDVDRTGLVALEDAPLLLSLVLLPLPVVLVGLFVDISHAFCSLSSMAKRSRALFLLRSAQSTPSNQIPSSSRSILKTSSRFIFDALIAGSSEAPPHVQSPLEEVLPSSRHSITNRRTMFFIGGSNTTRICR